MRKLLVVLIMLVISLSSVFAVTETTHEANLNIKAYKIGNYDTKYITLSVFDALVGDLDTIKKDDKIAQFEIVDAMEIPTFKKVEDLGNYNRGGFGSTGEK